MDQLTTVNQQESPSKGTATYTYLHQIAENIKRRSLIFLFTDMLQTETTDDALFEALRHLKHNKHEVVLFHPMDAAKERDFSFGNRPKRFVDVETGAHLDLYAENVQEAYTKAMENYLAALSLKCAQYRIKHVPVDIASDFSTVLNTFLSERQKFI